ncbi:methyltransferase domain-containing protein [Sulfitobacter sp. D35]|uniref:class I SAM-dependent methyltransferase n=1 Tax=Sulfitobacter sp. D35 TaxID=3083252 RepID=UPI00296E8253|nr:methyltransferase domain-containing protein [Sulfitobacter sp. D35]MDW4498421.1 methyltransferase domain-containing protein [Sulfitobacter sp. D35]
MSGPDHDIQEHYGQDGLFERLLSMLEAAGVPRDQLSAEHLKAVDEFHIGGVKATEVLLDPLNIGPGTPVLDIGSGIGGPARFMAARYDATVTGVDLTPAYVDTAARLTQAVGLEVRFVEGSALDLPFEPDSFDVATLIHVGMNLPDKPRLFAEAARVLAPGGTFAVYDVMRFGTHPEFPLPWAATPVASFLETPDTYLDAARAAGFTLAHRADRGEVAKSFFAEMQARMASGSGPAVGLPVLMGDTAPQKVANMVAAVNAGAIQPVEMVFRKGT